MSIESRDSTPPADPGPCRLPDARSVVNTRWLFQGENLRIGSWDCPVRTRERSCERSLDWFQIGFLDRGAFQLHSGGKAGLVDRSGALIHPPGAGFRTSHPFGCGDAGTFLALPPEVLQPDSGDFDVPRDLFREPFRMSYGAVTSQAYLRLKLLVERFGSDGSEESLELEETAISLVRTILNDSTCKKPAKPLASWVRVRRYEAVEKAKAVLASGFRRPQRLESVAAAVGVSPFHLCRIFREETGISLHQYVNQLRLRFSIPAVIRGEDLAQVALNSGFSSHSRFTLQFRLQFGVPPAVARDIFGGRLPRRLLSPPGAAPDAGS